MHKYLFTLGAVLTKIQVGNAFNRIEVTWLLSLENFKILLKEFLGTASTDKCIAARLAEIGTTFFQSDLLLVALQPAILQPIKLPI